MLLALISDIHSNYEALQVVLAEVKRHKPDMIYCLGDVVGYGADPILVLEALSNFKNIEFVMGNHDMGLLDKDYRKVLNEDAQTVLNWTEQKLEKRWINFVSTFKNKIENKELKAFFFHSNPDAENDYLMFQNQISSFLKIQDSQREKGWVYLGGHTHLRTLSHIKTSFTLAHDFNGVSRKKLNPDMSYYINPGSVGQPRGSLGLEASYGLLDTEKKEYSSHLVAYNFELTQKKIIQANLPAFFAQRLAKGV